MSLKRALIALLAILAHPVSGADIYIPPDLEDWREWVLQDKEYRDCPHYFDRSPQQRDDYICAWPATLDLTVIESGARFAHEWTVYAREQWVELPGNTDYWPDAVTVDGRPVSVVARNNVPGIQLPPGNWRVTGRFEWEERPGVLRIPSGSGLIRLTIDGKLVDRPEINGSGVFLGERRRDTRARDSIRTIVHRLVADDIPTSLMTQLQIDVSGSVREEEFGAVLPEGFIPLSISSALPAKLESDGTLHLQVRPGRWTIHVLARGRGVEDSILRLPPGSNMAAEEIWSYRSNSELRTTAVEGLPPVDPSQADVPQEWRSLPAFRLQAGDRFEVVQRSRGVVSASNELELWRTLWLDFDGRGFVVEDEISGTMRTDWRLDMAGPFALLSATEGGENLLITKGALDGQTGIEVRRNEVDVEAIGRADTRAAMPVTGWHTRFDAVDTVLNLPPGHKLLMAPGVDEASSSWVSRWQLLDFFLVLIITIAVWRMLGTGAGVVALMALVLSFHELNAPAWLWLNILIAMALMRVAPAGRLRQLVSGYQALSAIALLFVLVPFVAGQLRIAIYPQLEAQSGIYGAAAARQQAVLYEAEEAARKRDSDLSLNRVAPSSAMMADEVVVSARKVTRSFSRYAPNAIVQAGPGIPSWRWNSYKLSWSGPVDAEQTMRLVIMPRWVVSLLRVTAVGLLLLFAAFLAAEILGRKWQLPGGLVPGSRTAASVAALGLLSGLMLVVPDAKADIPDATLLQELEQRLLKAPDCVPRCAEIVAADIKIGAETIAMQLSVHALESVAIPLPGSAEGWRPEAVSLEAAGGVRVIRARNGSLWMHMGTGRHDVQLRGPIPAVDSLEIPFLTPPRVIDIESDGWFVAGMKDKRLVSGSLQLTRLQSTGGEDGSARWESSRFPTFVRIERVIELDLDWRVRTTVYRMAPAQGALTLDVPLLDGEQVVSGDFTIDDGRILVSMNPQQAAVSWVSNLPLQSPLELQAADTSSWSEVWQFAVGNVWNASFDGVPESNSGEDADGVRLAVFHPRGAERLTLAATRPEASAGSTLAFDSVAIAVVEGSRTRDVDLRLEYRSTRGSRHTISLPADAEINSISIDGEEQTLRAENGALNLPILPGSHSIAISWRENSGARWWSTTPEIDIGAPASNIEMTVTKSRDRWLLATRGPQLGPAVLYWSELAALILFALILGRVPITELTTRHWLLLGVGFSTFNWFVLGVVIAWLMLCGLRNKLQRDLSWWQFNAMQIVLAGMTIFALAGIILSLPSGLLGSPDMHVTGHNSHGNVLAWFADGSDSLLPLAAYVSLPMWTYKTLILAWALWLSFALLRWLPWVWSCFSKDGFWRPRQKAAAVQAESTG